MMVIVIAPGANGQLIRPGNVPGKRIAWKKSSLRCYFLYSHLVEAVGEMAEESHSDSTMLEEPGPGVPRDGKKGKGMDAMHISSTTMRGVELSMLPLPHPQCHGLISLLEQPRLRV